MKIPKNCIFLHKKIIHSPPHPFPTPTPFRPPFRPFEPTIRHSPPEPPDLPPHTNPLAHFQMSSPVNNNKQIEDQKQPDADDEKQPQTSSKKTTKKATDDKKKKDSSWGPTRVVRGNVDVDVRLLQDIKTNTDRLNFLQLPTLDPSIHPFDLVQSTFGPNDDLAQVGKEVFDFLRGIDSFVQQDGGHFYGACTSSPLNARYSLSTYRDASSNQIVFHIRQYDGCGIEFARFFANFQQQFGADKNRVIHTFEAPALAPLPIEALTTKFSNLSVNGQDNCVFEHSIPNSLLWSLETLTSLRDSILTNDQLRLQQEAKFEECEDFEGLIVPGVDCCGRDEDFVELPLTDAAQGRMLTQAFATLNGSLNAIANQSYEPTEEERQQLGEFFTNLVSLDENGPKCAPLLQHAVLDVQVATVECFIAAAVANVVGEEVVRGMAPFVCFMSRASYSQILGNESLSPFDKMAHCKITAAVAQVGDCLGQFLEENDRIEHEQFMQEVNAQLNQ